jgi:hypothetical protein
MSVRGSLFHAKELQTQANFVGDASGLKKCQCVAQQALLAAFANRTPSEKLGILKFWEQNRKSLSTSLPVELKGKVKPIVSQAKGYWFLSFRFINMSNGSSNGNDPISNLGIGWRKLIFSSGFH